MALRPGRHGGMSSSEFTELVQRNSDFLTVNRFGRGDGGAGLHNSITGKYVAGIGGGWLREYSWHDKPAYGCACTPEGLCRSGYHGTGLHRGWRNILYDLVQRSKVRPTKAIKRLLGDYETMMALDHYHSVNAPMNNPFQKSHYQSINA